ncbi:phosphoribulokinase [Actinomyces sp. 2119]|uniref:Phosphoribulokinase n=1 Tax=Actinomyces lilanjuaniae TaxID=2321394 RepID=A0ABN5PRF3_9ACTO|nr:MULTISPECIES: AAA family ATPase [Actinomyces]AYD90609.1 phosphoribulokinase [Actinomyces lilanjuaniae]RJF43934.1 phosphoribulokinase [Actinomyces sp. 2119]
MADSFASSAVPPLTPDSASDPSAPSPLFRTGSAEALLLGLVDHLATALGEAPSRLVVGLAGAPGSGKSTLATRLQDLLAQRGLLAGAVPMDGFHLSNAVLDALGRHDRKGAPDTFDVEGLLATLDRVRAQDLPEVLAPVYRRDLHEPVAAGTLVSGPGAVVTEGNYLALDSYGWQEVRTRIDLLVFLEVPEEELVARLVTRHQDFGRSAADAGHWVRTVDLPNARLVASSASRCHEVWTLATTSETIPDQ